MVEAARFWLTACDWVLPGWPNQDRIRSKGDASSYCMQRHARIEERTHNKKEEKAQKFKLAVDGST